MGDPNVADVESDATSDIEGFEGKERVDSGECKLDLIPVEVGLNFGGGK